MFRRFGWIIVAFFLICSSLSLLQALPTKKKKQPFWNVMMQLGGKGKAREKKAYGAIEDFIRYTKASLYHTEFSKEAQDYRDLYDRDLSTFDIEDIYETLPYQLEESKWKGSHHYEENQKGKVLVSLKDPEISTWLNLSQHQQKAPWKKVKNLGDSDQRFYVTPRKGTNGDLHFEAYFFERMGLGNINTNEILMGLRALLTYMERGVREVPEGFTPTSEMKSKFTGLSRGELYVMDQFREDMPSLYDRVTRYVDIKGVSIPMEHKGVKYCRFNLHLSLKMDGLKKDFPKIYRYLLRIRGLFEIKSRMYSEQGYYMGFMKFSTTSFTYHFSYCMKDGRFLPSSTSWEPVDFKGYSPWDLGTQKNTFHNDVQVRVNGIRMIIRNIKLYQTYTHKKDTTSIDFLLKDTPIIQKVDGSAYGIVPVWLIDLLLPSNLETLMKDFFQALAKGRQGQGWFLKIQTHSTPNNRIDMAVGSEILSNGIIKIGLKIAADILIPDRETSQEIASFGKVFWHAFVSDYFRFRYEE